MRAERGKAAEARAVAGIVALILLAYWGALSAGFVWDDILLVEQNQRIRHLANIPSFFSTDYWGGDYPSGLYRPLTLTAYAAEYALFGSNPAGYHVVNLAVHFINALLIFLIGRRLFRATLPAWIAAALFAVHPVQSETVIGIAGLAGLLSSLFGLGAWYLAYKRKHWMAAAALLLLLSMLAKETGVVWVVPILAEFLLVRKGSKRAAIAPALLFLSAIAVYAGMRSWALGGVGVPTAGQIWAGENLATRVVTMLRGYAHYVRLLFFPARLCGDYSPNSIPVSTALDGYSLAGLVALLLTAGGLFLSFRRSPIAFLGLLLFVAGLTPVANIFFPIGAVIAERFLYLPMTGIVLLVTVLLLRWAERWRRRVVIVITLALLVTLVARTSVRACDWRDHETFMESLIDAVPDSYRAKEALAEMYLRDGKAEWALSAARKARAIFPASRSLRHLEARAMRADGRLDDSIELLREMVRENPRDRRAFLLLGETLYDARRFDEALAANKSAAALYGDDYRALIGIGRSLDELGNTEEAEKAYRQALRLRPDLEDVSMRLGTIAMTRNAFEEAKKHFRNVKSGPNQFFALVFTGEACQALGQDGEAERVYQLATRIRPREPVPWTHLAEIYKDRGDVTRAREMLMEAKSAAPGDPVIEKLLNDIE